ncbi:bifunctional folylpolyglutamate synthase/dihydrofolate synthase [Pedomonas mirosovicensis]|uniref:bifunctional folylpolyglutamate synthase/dihydrofolate synthase n=1 Tax=Pedomonas mirosovicensis TaxID=2908641 RepID=UPI0021697DDE|nr:folylpolyglutamate synthase/dihydrofolate synthase family protein [Pedomonas mirosovicensis]MCH8684190.1 bifunctional folylpolyglutamate synthase/dihydrofolate synthase [Pedomonas mirosovicensis]
MPNTVVETLLAEARSLHPSEIDLSLERLRRLLAKLGDPQDRLPPVFHVAGTNGKGSTVAFLRACLEAAGKRVHVYTSPHLVRYNERIRLAGKLIDDDTLVSTLRDVLQINNGAPITVFEILTAAAFLAFSRTPADACVLEVGMGGRLDATNVVRRPAACGIAQLGLDHTSFLGSTILDIAAEKAGIAKQGVPLVLSRYPRTVTARIGEVAGLAGAKLVLRGQDWDATLYNDAFHYKDSHGKLDLTPPRLIGAHQIDNAGLAIAMLRHQSQVHVPDAAFRAGLGWADWPARLQRIATGPLYDLLPKGAELWLDGGHNPLAGRMLADRFRGHNLAERPFYLVVGMLTTKDAAGFLRPFASRATALYAVPIEGHEHFSPVDLAAMAEAIGLPGQPADSVAAALKAIANGADRQRPPVVLVCGSLYVAGRVLEESGLIPA